MKSWAEWVALVGTFLSAVVLFIGAIVFVGLGLEAAWNAYKTQEWFLAAKWSIACFCVTVLYIGTCLYLRDKVE